MFSAKSHADADLAGLLRDKVGHYAVYSDQREDKPEPAEDAEQHALRFWCGVVFGHLLVEVLIDGNGPILVEGPNSVLNRGSDWQGIGFCPGDEKDPGGVAGLRNNGM